MRANKHRRKGRNTRPFFLFPKPSERERKPTAKPTKPRKQDKTKRRSQAGKQDKSRTKAGQERKREENERRNTQQAPKPPNLSRTQKPHNPRKDLNLYKHTSAPQNALKTPLKCEIKPYSQATRQAKQERDKGRAKGRNTPKEREQERTACTRWTPPPPQRESHNGSPCTLKTQIYLKFYPFWSPKIPRKHQSKQINVYFCHFLSKICPDRLKIDDKRG